MHTSRLMLAALLYTACDAVAPPRLGMILPINDKEGEPLPHTQKSLTCAAKIAVAHVNARNPTVIQNLPTLLGAMPAMEALVYDSGYISRTGARDRRRPCRMRFGSRHTAHTPAH